jgi:hypothetical protein
MAARVHTEYLYYAFCSSCADGTEILSEDDAAAWADKHNAEQHEGAE